MTERLQQLLLFYEQDPSDPFNAYALALEYRKTDANEAGRYFERLLRQFPDYVPTYYQAAEFYAEQNRPDEVRRVYESGIVVARQQGNAHALRELRGAYQRWLDEQDE